MRKLVRKVEVSGIKPIIGADGNGSESFKVISNRYLLKENA